MYVDDERSIVVRTRGCGREPLAVDADCGSAPHRRIQSLASASVLEREKSRAPKCASLTLAPHPSCAAIFRPRPPTRCYASKHIFLDVDDRNPLLILRVADVLNFHGPLP